MTNEARLKYLSLALYVFGAIFVIGVYLMMMIWPAGWSWTPAQPEYEQMILGVYATLGVFMIIAARNPLAHRSLIQFAAWSSLVHGGIMLVQAVLDDTETMHLLGDVPALILVGVVLLALEPRDRASE